MKGIIVEELCVVKKNETPGSCKQRLRCWWKLENVSSSESVEDVLILKLYKWNILKKFRYKGRKE